MTRALYPSVAIFGAILIAATLAAWGQPIICTCGTIKLWVGTVFSPNNSQHIADWYTLSHILHGMLIILVARLIAPSLGFGWLFGIAVVTGVGWEIIEHTEWVLGKFRATTINQGYTGDSVLNAVADYVWMMGGFLVANALRTVWVVLILLAFEVGAALIARDSLTLTTLMLFYPVDAIEVWQQELNPKAAPAN